MVENILYNGRKFIGIIVKWSTFPNCGFLKCNNLYIGKKYSEPKTLTFPVCGSNTLVKPSYFSKGELVVFDLAKYNNNRPEPNNVESFDFTNKKHREIAYDYYYKRNYIIYKEKVQKKRMGFPTRTFERLNKISILEFSNVPSIPIIYNIIKRYKRYGINNLIQDVEKLVSAHGSEIDYFTGLRNKGTKVCLKHLFASLSNGDKVIFRNNFHELSDYIDSINYEESPNIYFSMFPEIKKKKVTVTEQSQNEDDKEKKSQQNQLIDFDVNIENCTLDINHIAEDEEYLIMKSLSGHGVDPELYGF